MTPKQRWTAKKLLVNPVGFLVAYSCLFGMSMLVRPVGGLEVSIGLLWVGLLNLFMWIALTFSYDHQPTHGTSSALGATMLTGFVLIALETVGLLSGSFSQAFTITAGAMTFFAFACTSMLWRLLHDHRSWSSVQAGREAARERLSAVESAKDEFATAMESVLKPRLSARVSSYLDRFGSHDFYNVMYAMDSLLARCSRAGSGFVSMRVDGAIGRGDEYSTEHVHRVCVEALRSSHRGSSERDLHAWAQLCRFAMYDVAREMPRFFLRMQLVKEDEDGTLEFRWVSPQERIQNDATRWAS
jgi:ABC-type multidrug transport system fused ATPase/permease subunit